MVNVPPLKIEKILSQQTQNSAAQNVFDLQDNFEVDNDADNGQPQTEEMSPEDLKSDFKRNNFKSPSLLIQTDLNDFDDERLPTEVHYESDSAEICEVRIDKLEENLTERRPLSASKRERKKRNEGRGRVLRIGKQGSGPMTSTNAKGKRRMTPPQLKRGKQSSMIVQPFMSTTNKRALEIKSKMSGAFEGAFLKKQKRKKQIQQKAKTVDLFTARDGAIEENENDISPPADDDERLSKQDGLDETHEERSSSDGDLPGNDVPEILSADEDEEIVNTKEIDDAARRAMQGSFMPIMAILETQLDQALDPNMTIDPDQGLVLLHSAAYYGKIKPMRSLIEKYHADVKMPDYRGQTPLHIAALTGNLEATVYLADRLGKAASQARDNNLTTPLMNCIVSNNEHAFIYLHFKLKCGLSDIDINGDTLLHLAAEHNAYNIASLLRHLQGAHTKESDHNSSLEKIQKIKQQAIELHLEGSPRNANISANNDTTMQAFSLQLNRTEIDDSVKAKPEDLRSEFESESDTAMSSSVAGSNSFFDVNATNMLGQTPIFKAILN